MTEQDNAIPVSLRNCVTAPYSHTPAARQILRDTLTEIEIKKPLLDQ